MYLKILSAAIAGTVFAGTPQSGFAQKAAPSQAPDGFWTRDNMLGDIGGLRTTLSSYGITLGLNDGENLLGNLSGGTKTGTTMQGVTTGTIDIDTGKAFNLPGGSIHISALQVHGKSLSPYYLHDLQTANGNEAEDGSRLWELWYDQQFAANTFDIKIGQQSIDNEFIGSTYSGLFVNTMAGWPLIPSSDLYGGGPAYPLSSLGIRVRAEATGNTTILAGMFDDNPGGGAFTDDAQFLDRNGGRFNLKTGALIIAEIQYTAKLSALPGTYKLGFWYDIGSFPDQRFGTDGLSLANPASNGNPLMHHGDYSVYGVVDQTIWQSAVNTARSASIFGRIMGVPVNQNLIDFSFNGGVTLQSPLPGRDNDQAGIDFGIGRVSSRTASLDQDSGSTEQTTEELLEFTYQAHVVPWLIMQPDVQYIINPGAGLADPNDPAHKLRNEFVAGARMIVTF